MEVYPITVEGGNSKCDSMDSNEVSRCKDVAVLVFYIPGSSDDVYLCRAHADVLSAELQRILKLPVVHRGD